NVGGAEGLVHEVSSPILDKSLPSPPPSPRARSGKRPADDATAEPKRPRFPREQIESFARWIVPSTHPVSLLLTS
ncbi:hypothetical protein PIB30_112013, partial [Stylosanthes scabra]|nr:hypothetical protein [Stylosanthes scabra]